MRTIYKYPIAAPFLNELDLPVGAEVISVETVQDVICVYAIVDTDVRETEVHKFWIFGTGHPMPKELKAKFICTVLQDIYVFHVFEEIVEKTEE